MDDTVSYHFAKVKQRRKNRHEIDFQLAFRQQPKQSRMCGVGEKADRRPIDPPPIVQLRVVDPSLPPLEANAYLQNPYYFMYVSLMAADLEEEVHLLRDGKTRSTTGSVVSSLYHLKDTNNTDAGFFVFPDLSVRMEGKYRLKFSLFEIIGKEVFHCKSILSDQFIVYSAKKFPGMEESTFLSRSFADQGLKIRIRKELRQRRRKRPDSSESPHMQTIDKRLRQDSIVPTTTSLLPINSMDPPPSNMYNAMSSSYGERPPGYFDPNDGDWTGSRAQQQQQQQQQRSWQLHHTAISSESNPYYINTDQSKMFSTEAYNESTPQYHTSPPPLPSYSSPLSYTHHVSPTQQQPQSHTTSYSFQPSARDPFQQQQQQQHYTDTMMHQLPTKHDNLYINKRR
ncbi:velvet factor-domain-containing protein [Chlamydoabsidia padenii]|nr:velvet factor-domain-containing protein [Chlamydoabsidia padenii]